MDAFKTILNLTPKQRLTWYATSQGRLLEVRQALSYRMGPVLPPRSTITGMSPAARIRMLRSIARIDWSRVGPSLLVTLTYPDPLGDTTYADRRTNLYLFHRRIEKYMRRQVGVLWRTEWVPRKSGQHLGKMLPHVHLVVFDVRYIPYSLVREWWAGILGWDGPLATDVRRAGNGETAARYAAKYAAKQAAPSSSLDSAAYLNNLTGRLWGLKRRKVVPFAAKKSYLLDDETAAYLRRIGSVMLRHYDARNGGSFTIFGDAAVKIGAEIGILGLPQLREVGNLDTTK
jgi:hypothetical protein